MCLLALISHASYPVLVHRLVVSFRASFPRSVTLTQLHFLSLAVVSSREDFHLQDRAHAGRTHPPMPEGTGFLRRSSGSIEQLLKRFGGFLLLAIYIAHFTGATGVSRPENIDRADPIGVLLEAAFHASEPFLCLPVLPRDIVAFRTSPARVPRRHDDQFTTVPRQLVLQLAAELEPTLIEDGFVQTRLGSNVFARRLG